MKFFVHLSRFVTVSITGSVCWLNCKFCRGRYLRGMLGLNPRSVPAVFRELSQRGVKGVLLSGGFTREGVLPIGDYVEVLRDAKKEYGFVFNAHLGLQRDRDLLELLKGVIDVVDFEFTLSDYIIKYVRGLDVAGEVYVKSLEAMLDSGLYVVPHLYLWHPGSTAELLKREFSTVKELGLRNATVLVYIPQGEGTALPKAGELVELLRVARSVYDGELYIGCMRPTRLKEDFDERVIRENLAERMANPSLRAYRSVEGELYDACCSIPEHLLGDFKLKS